MWTPRTDHIDTVMALDVNESYAATLTNTSGAQRVVGDVVIFDTAANSSFETTTTVRDPLVAGVVAATIDAGDPGLVQYGGVCVVKVDAATTRGDWLVTSTTATQATPQAAYQPGAFARALTATGAAGTVTAFLTLGASPDGISDLGDILFHTDDLLLLDFQRWLKNVGDADSQLITSRMDQVVHKGALRYVPGRFPGKRALAVEPAGTNDAKNSVFGVNATDDWTLTNGARARVTTRAKVGTACCRLTAGAAVDATQETTTGCLVANNDHVTMYAWVYREAAVGCNVILQDTTTPAARHTVAATKLDGWEYIEVTWQNTTGGAVTCKLQIVNTEGDGASNIWFDAVQIENDQDYATSLIYGDAGPGYAYTGAPNNSTSTRTATEVNLDAHVGLISGNDTLTFAMRVQMPYDADGEWPGAVAAIFEARSVAAPVGRILFYYNLAGRTFSVEAHDDAADATTLTSAAQTFSAGDWIHLALTFSFNASGAGDYRLYIAGALSDSDTSANVAAPTLSEWNVGSYTAATYQSGLAFDEFAVLDRVLTAAEVAARYALQRPLIDEGALETRPIVPGSVYGQWTLFNGGLTAFGTTSTVNVPIGSNQNAYNRFNARQVASQIQFQAVLLTNHASGTATATLQYYDTVTAAWISVTDSPIAVTGIAANLAISDPLALPQREVEVRAVLKTNNVSYTAQILKAEIITSAGMSTTL